MNQHHRGGKPRNRQQLGQFKSREVLPESKFGDGFDDVRNPSLNKSKFVLIPYQIDSESAEREKNIIESSKDSMRQYPGPLFSEPLVWKYLNTSPLDNGPVLNIIYHNNNNYAE